MLTVWEWACYTCDLVYLRSYLLCCLLLLIARPGGSTDESLIRSTIEVACAKGCTVVAKGPPHAVCCFSRVYDPVSCHMNGSLYRACCRLSPIAALFEFFITTRNSTVHVLDAALLVSSTRSPGHLYANVRRLPTRCGIHHTCTALYSSILEQTKHQTHLRVFGLRGGVEVGSDTPCYIPFLCYSLLTTSTLFLFAVRQRPPSFSTRSYATSPPRRAQYFACRLLQLTGRVSHISYFCMLLK